MQYDITINTFAMGGSKERALKPLEEAAEIFGAWQSYGIPGLSFEVYDDRRTWLADEIADCIQACCNLADTYGIDLHDAMLRCEERNRDRGRYE